MSRTSNSEGEIVCVTGGSGYIGSWVVRLLLDRGYTVHATVKDLKDDKETKHLQALEGAQSRLRLFQIDLLGYDSIVAAVNGAKGVFHMASPCTIDEVKDPEKELLAPAIKGTENVLAAAKECGVRRVVVTSSASSITPNRNWPADKVKNEDCWTDVHYCKQNGNDGDVKVLVGNNFDEIVLDKLKDVLLEIYALWCGHCHALEPVYNKLGKHLKRIHSLVIVKMDGTTNKHPRAKSFRDAEDAATVD